MKPQMWSPFLRSPKHMLPQVLFLFNSSMFVETRARFERAILQAATTAMPMIPSFLKSVVAPMKDNFFADPKNLKYSILDSWYEYFTYFITKHTNFKIQIYITLFPVPSSTATALAHSYMPSKSYAKSSPSFLFSSPANPTT